MDRYGGERKTVKEKNHFQTGGSVWLNEEKMAKKLGEKISTHMVRKYQLVYIGIFYIFKIYFYIGKYAQWFSDIDE